MASLGRAFWRFWLSSGLSNLADGIFQVALPLLALTLTRSPVLIAGLMVFAKLPWLIFAPVAGVMLDRTDRRRMIGTVDVLRAALIGLAALLVLVRVDQMWWLYLLAFGLGCLETLADTGSLTVVPSIVPRDQLERANSRLYGVQVIGNYFAGPSLGGLLAGTSVALALSSSSLAYLVAALAVFTVAGRFRPQRVTPHTSVRSDLTTGLRYLVADPVLRRILLLTAGVSMIYTAVNSVLPVFAVAPGPMGLSATGFGLFEASTAIGAIVASGIAERVVKRFGPSRALKISIAAMTLSNTAPLAVQPVLVSGLWFFGAFFIVVFSVLSVSVRQRLVPDHLMGRVQSGYRMVQFGAAPLGAALGGALGQWLGLRATFAVAGVCTLLLLLGTRPLTDAVLTPDQDVVAPEPAEQA